MESKKLSKKEQWIVDWLKAKFDSDPVNSWSAARIGKEYCASVGKKVINTTGTVSNSIHKLVRAGFIEKIEGVSYGSNAYRYKIQING